MTITTKTYLFGDPIETSLSIVFHNACYAVRDMSLTHAHSRIQSTDLDAFMQIIQRDDCGGSAVTMPNKVSVLSRPEVEEVEEQARMIGACNTLYWKRIGDGKKRLVAANVSLQREIECRLEKANDIVACAQTDVAGIRDSIQTAATASEVERFSALPSAERIGLVVGGGGTTRTAIATLRMDLGCTGPIYVVNRFEHEVIAITQDLKSRGLGDVHYLSSPDAVTEQFSALGRRPHYVINAVPSTEPATEGEIRARATLQAVLSLRSASRKDGYPAAFLEMCYFPHAWTDACTLAQTNGWTVVSGEQCMFLQAIAQQKLWFPTPSINDASLLTAGRRAVDVEQQRRARGLEPQ